MVKALVLFKRAYSHLQVAMMPCKNMSDDLAAVKAWAYIFDERDHLVEVITEHYMDHNDAIKESIGQTVADWNSGLFFKAGEASAETFTLLFGQVE